MTDQLRDFIHRGRTTQQAMDDLGCGATPTREDSMTKQAAEVLVRESTTPMAALVPASEQAAILNMIERAARDPAVDIDKLARLLTLRKEAEAEQAKRAFNEAMTSAQAEMRRVATDSDNLQTRSRYASYAALDRMLRPIYTTHHFGLSFNTEPSPQEQHVRVVCLVTHGGFERRYQVDMPADGKGAKGGDVMTKTHATSSAISYGMRNLLKMIFNVAIGVDDDDGNAAGATDLISDEQAAVLNDLIVKSKTDINKFLTWVRVESIADIQAKFFESCKSVLEQKIGGRAS